MSDSARLDALELAVARLTKEVVVVRAELRSLREVAGESVVGVTAVTSATNATSVTSVTSEAVESIGEGAGGQHAPYVSDELRRLAAATHARDFASERRGSESSSSGAAASSARAARSTLFQRENLEAIIGRYGTLALAAFTILMGLGAFIGWAVKNGVIGPELRVALGAVAAGIVGTIGWRMRRGESPRFGSVLLALALAIVHVVCWGAGPVLQLIPSAVALGVATVASGGLAALALHDEDQSLFNVGFGGALLAPFVTSSDTGDAVLLLLYGAVVLGAGMRAMRDRAWSKTPFVLGLAIVAYAAAATGQLRGSDLWARAAAPSIFGIATAWLALILVQGKARERVALIALLSTAGTLVAMHDRPSVAAIRFALAALLTISGFLVASGAGSGFRARIVTSLILPLCGLFAALATLPDAASRPGVTVAIVWAAGSILAAIVNRDGARGWHAFTGTAFGGMAVAFEFTGNTIGFCLATAAFGVAAAIAMRRFTLRGVGLATLGWLSLGAIVAANALMERAQWLRNPFLTPASGAAAAICAAWLFFSWHAARTGAADGGVMTTLPRTVLRILGAVLTFLWIHSELARTVSLDVSTFLLVAYYAVTGVLAIGVGRWRSIPLLRQLGLALAVLAAVKAMVETSSLSIGWRVGGYLLAGVFLLGVAYWYRGRSGTTSIPRSSGAAAPDDTAGAGATT